MTLFVELQIRSNLPPLSIFMIPRTILTFSPQWKKHYKLDGITNCSSSRPPTQRTKKKRYKSSSKDSFTFEPIGCSYWHLIPIVSDSGRVPPALPPALFPVLSDTAIRLWHSAEESLGLERSKWWFNWPERFESRAVISWITMISFIRWLLDINRFNLYVFFCLFWLQLRTFMCKTWWCTSGNDLCQGHKLHPLNQVFLMTLM